MGQVLIRNLDDALLADYRRVAKAGGRSLEAELRAALDRARPRPALTTEELIALSRRLRAMTPHDARRIDSVAIIREARDRYEGPAGAES